MRNRVAIAVIVTVVAGLVYVLFGNRGGGGVDGYGVATSIEWEKACSPGQNEALCACTYDKLVDRVPFDDFDDVVDGLRTDGSLPANVQALVQECVLEETPNPSITIGPSTETTG